MQSKVKVSTEGLLQSVRQRRERIIRNHEKDLGKYEKDRERAQGAVAKALRDAADRAERGDLPDSNYRNRLEIPWRGRIPSKPCLSMAEIDRLIKTLELASEPTITISADDAAEYLG